MQQKTYNYIELFGSSTRDTDIGGRSENNIKCMTISDGRTKQLDIIVGFMPHHWLYE